MRSIYEHRRALGVAAIVVSIAFAAPAAASGSLTISGGAGVHGNSGVLTFGNFGSPASSGNSGSGGSSSSSGITAPSMGLSISGTNTPLNLSGSSESGGSGSSGSSGGGLVWGDPLSADIGTFGKVHTNLRYFGQSGYNGTQQAVGINFSIQY